MPAICVLLCAVKVPCDLRVLLNSFVLATTSFIASPERLALLATLAIPRPNSLTSILENFSDSTKLLKSSVRLPDSIPICFSVRSCALTTFCDSLLSLNPFLRFLTIAASALLCSTPVSYI